MVSPNQNNTLAISIRNISKTFDSKKVLDNVILDIEKNTFVCFLGPSGCGKTTLLRIISGLEQADGGDIFMFGKNINNVPISGRRLGVVFQSYALFPNLTVQQNIQYGMDKLDRHSRNALTQDLLNVIGMSEKAHVYPNALSGGQQQRVAIARAIAVNPSVLLLDEPLSALDKNIRNALRIEIKNIHRKYGLTSIMVTHDQEEAFTMADKIVVMNNNKIEQIGTPQDIYNHPATEFVARFIGNMSFLPKMITGRDEVIAIRDEDCEILSIADPKGGVVGIIESIDFKGASNRLYIKIDDFILTAVLHSDTVRGKTVQVGDRVKVSLPPEKWHVYA